MAHGLVAATTNPWLVDPLRGHSKPGILGDPAPTYSSGYLMVSHKMTVAPSGNRWRMIESAPPGGGRGMQNEDGREVGFRPTTPGAMRIEDLDGHTWPAGARPHELGGGCVGPPPLGPTCPVLSGICPGTAAPGPRPRRLFSARWLGVTRACGRVVSVRWF